jgi:hypothetical protein
MSHDSSRQERGAVGRSAHIAPAGDGFRLETARLYVWDESFSEAQSWGVELGVLSARRVSSRRDDYGAVASPRSNGRPARPAGTGRATTP